MMEPAVEFAVGEKNGFFVMSLLERLLVSMA